MTGYAQMTVRRNRDGSIVIITESAETDPIYNVVRAWDWYDAVITARDWIEDNIDQTGKI